MSVLLVIEGDKEKTREQHLQVGDTIVTFGSRNSYSYKNTRSVSVVLMQGLHGSSGNAAGAFPKEMEVTLVYVQGGSHHTHKPAVEDTTASANNDLKLGHCREMVLSRIAGDPNPLLLRRPRGRQVVQGR